MKAEIAFGSGVIAVRNLKTFLINLASGVEKIPFLHEILITLLAINSVYWFFPGLMTYDSFFQYSEVLGITPLSDSHSSLMGYLWRALVSVYQSPGVMLIWGQFVYWIAVYLWSRFLFVNHWKRIVFSVCFGLWPPLYIISLHLWKDVGMMVGFSLSLFFSLTYRKQGGLFRALFAFLFLFYGVAMRLNAISGALPLAILLSEALVYRMGSSKKNLRIVALTLVILATQMAMISAINKTVKRVYALGTIFAWDIGAISIAENQNLYPKYLPRLVPEDQLLSSTIANFNIDGNYFLWDTIKPFPPPELERQFHKDFFNLILSYPMDYLAHRLRVFTKLIGLSDETTSAYYAGIHENELGITFSNVKADSLDRVFEIFNWFVDSLIYRVWFYLLLGIALFIKIWQVWKESNKRLTINVLGSLMLLLSGWLIVLPLFFLAPSADFRYNIWLIYSTLLAWFMLYRRPADHFPN
jgi:hypothetical protein